MAAVALFIYISKDHEQDNQDDRKQSKESNHNDRKHPTFADNDIHIQVAYDRDIRNVNKAKERGRMEIPTILGLVPVALLFYAPAHRGEYGFFIALRIMVCILSIYRIYKLYEIKSKYTWLSLIYIAAIILFQPFWSWGIERESWAWIDILYGIIFLIYSIRRIMLDLKSK
jgi:hypothetical protein